VATTRMASIMSMMAALRAVGVWCVGAIDCVQKAALISLLAVFAAAPAPAQTIFFEAARVIPGDGSAAIENAAILVDGGMIVRIGRKGEIVAPPGAVRVELDGKTVMPAIISPHVHPGFQKGLTYSVENFTRENILADLNRELYFGVSTVMSLGIEKGDVMDRIRADQAAGRLGGARLLIAGRGIGAPNAGPGAAAYANIAYEITTEDQAKRAVEELAARQVDIIKIWVDDRGGRAPKLPFALSHTVIEQGHARGFKVAAHIFYHDDAVELAVTHGAEERQALDQVVARLGKQAAFRQARNRMAGAANTLQERGDSMGRSDLAHEIHRPDVDPQLERCRRDERLERAGLEPGLCVEAAFL